MTRIAGLLSLLALLLAPLAVQGQPSSHYVWSNCDVHGGHGSAYYGYLSVGYPVDYIHDYFLAWDTLHSGATTSAYLHHDETGPIYPDSFVYPPTSPEDYPSQITVQLHYMGFVVSTNTCSVVPYWPYW